MVCCSRQEIIPCEINKIQVQRLFVKKSYKIMNYYNCNMAIVDWLSWASSKNIDRFCSQTKVFLARNFIVKLPQWFSIWMILKRYKLSWIVIHTMDSVPCLELQGFLFLKRAGAGFLLRLFVFTLSIVRLRWCWPGRGRTNRSARSPQPAPPPARGRVRP